jgi:hypothetical protein
MPNKDNYFQTAISSFREALTNLGPSAEVRNPSRFHLLIGLTRLAQGLKQHEEKMESLKASFATSQPPE